jgi:hypothetical protein
MMFRVITIDDKVPILCPTLLVFHPQVPFPLLAPVGQNLRGYA